MVLKLCIHTSTAPQSKSVEVGTPADCGQPDFVAPAAAMEHVSSSRDQQFSRPLGLTRMQALVLLQLGAPFMLQPGRSYMNNRCSL